MNKTILLADDSVTIRKVVELTFMDEDFELIAVGSGTEALERFDRGIDLVIADVHMPGATGYEVCRQVKEESANTPVLLLAGTFEEFDEGAASEAGADDFLKKPFDSQDLLNRVRELLERSAEGGKESGAESEPLGAGDSVAAEAPERAPKLDAAAGAAAMDSTPKEGERAGAAVRDSHRSAASASSAGGGEVHLSDEVVDRIARRVVELLSEEVIREVVWEVIPDLAEIVIKERLAQLESQVE
jgi:DNA-binding response OmpR family regulator